MTTSSALLTINDPYTLLVALNVNGTACGHLYIDDGDSLDYRNGKYCDLQFIFKNSQLISQFIDEGRCKSKAWIEKVIILGIPNVFKKATINLHNRNHKDDLELLYDAKTYSLTVRKPDVPVNEEWTISFDEKIIPATESINQ